VNVTMAFQTLLSQGTDKLLLFVQIVHNRTTFINFITVSGKDGREIHEEREKHPTGEELLSIQQLYSKFPVDFKNAILLWAVLFGKFVGAACKEILKA
jgi:hypothetical protein